MKRNASLEEISDGKRYEANDMVRANCHGCDGCSDCCRGMGNTVVLDPYDIYRMTVLRERTFMQLLAEGIELGMVDGLILPSLKMSGKDNACSYLNAEGRCSIHPFRPGICRLFPLGRIYENGGFYYFLQTKECSNTSRSKIKVRQWIDTPDLKENEQFESSWHYFLKDVTRAVEHAEKNKEEAARENACKKILQVFYLQPYEKDNFYQQFAARLKQWENSSAVEEKENKI